MTLEKIDEVIDRYPDKQEVLIQLLLDIQSALNWIPKEAVLRVSKKLGISISQVYRVASFYKAISLTPRGKHTVNVCLGTACHVRGSSKTIDKVEEFLGIRAGETTEDMKFTLERVNCLGCCALGPVMLVDKDYHGKMTPSKIVAVLQEYD